MKTELQIEHSELVRRLRKPGLEIHLSLSDIDCDLLHMAVGVCTEAGELLDAVKKAVIYRKPLDRENVIEELGDLEFYMEGVRDILGIPRSQTLSGNIAKLTTRYGKTYSNQAAQERVDKQ